MQQEYIRGVSEWKFNMEDLRNEAALVGILLPDHLFNFNMRFTKVPFVDCRFKMTLH